MKLTTTGTFNKFILYNNIDTAAKIELAARSGRIGNEVLILNNTEILCRKVLCRVEADTIVGNISRIIDDIVTYTWPLSAEASEQLRVEYARSICDCMRALKDDFILGFLGRKTSQESHTSPSLLPAAFAAVGDAQLFLNNVSSIEDILTACKDFFPYNQEDIFPNALNAAVAAGQHNMVDLILRYLVTTVKGPWETGTWDEMRTVARGLVEALGVAIRTSHDVLGETILQCLVKNKALAGSVHQSALKKLYESCVRFGNTRFFYKALYWKRDDQLPDLSRGSRPTDQLSRDELTYIMCRGPSRLLRHIIKTGGVSLIDVDGETPLWLALKVQKYRMATVLLEEGADIEGLAPGRKLTAYWRAYKNNDGDAQWLLISKGADTRSMSKHGTPRKPPASDRKPDIMIWGGRHKFENWKPSF
jgi:hypothetical protein